MPIRTVNPGDLITALDWNDLITLINGMEIRIEQLESGPASGGAPRITQVLPPGPVTAGDTIRIFGSNFDFTTGGHSVFFGNTRAITFFNGSSDTLLIVRVPDPTDGATETGASMILTVGNLKSTATWPITVRSRPVVTSGNIQFTFLGTRPSATPTQNTTFFYDFELRSQASEDLIVTIVPTVAVVPPLPVGVSDPNLQGLISVLDSDQSSRENGQVNLLEGATKTVSLRLNLPNNINQLRYALSAAASAPGVTTRVETLPTQQVGQVSEQPDSTVTSFEFSSIAEGEANFSSATGGTPGIDGTISVREDTQATVEIGAVFLLPPATTNQYQITAAVDGGEWTASVNPIMQNPLTVVSPGGSVSVFFDINAPGSSTSGILHLTLTRQGGGPNNRRQVSYRLNLF
jgi:hypothetical protein